METARPPIRAQRAPIAFRSAVASWRFGKPIFYHAVDVGSGGLRVLAMHLLPIQPDAKFVHIHGGL